MVCEARLGSDGRDRHSRIFEELGRQTEPQLVDELRVRGTRGGEAPLQCPLSNTDPFRYVPELGIAASQEVEDRGSHLTKG